MQKYSVNQYLINNILSWVQSEEIAIPEIQRPFVWNTTKVRDLMDSLYKGFPVGYIIAWKNPDVRLKDGTTSSGKKVLVDGQQRTLALQAAVLGKEIIDKNYRKIRIKIAFHPIKEKFETSTPAIEKDKEWLSDIAEILKNEENIFELEETYYQINPEVDKKKFRKNLQKLIEIKNKQIGFIELDHDLDIETVTNIFIRINSKGVVLSQADFVMSKIASHGIFGVNMRKCIDYFCHLSREPEFHKHIKEVDEEFTNTEFLPKISWLRNATDDLYIPDYHDVLRVSFSKEFNRGKLSELVSLLSGRNFETRTFEEHIQEDSFEKLKNGVLSFTNETHYKRFIMIIKSTGFIINDLISSKNALNFAYILYLKLRDKNLASDKIESFVKKWFVMSLLTSRYSSAAESAIDYDIKHISKNGVEKSLQEVEDAHLSESFWSIGLIQELDKASSFNPFLKLFFASQIFDNNKGFLSTDITIRDLITHRGDKHHLFPRDYLKKFGCGQSDYNQIANFVYTQSEINIKIKNNSPQSYFEEILKQCAGEELGYGAIRDKSTLLKNLEENCIPESIFEGQANNYQEFLEARRNLMAKKIENYYKNL